MRKGLQRCGKSCRLRWPNYLRPGIKRGNFTPQEEEVIIRFHSLLGNRWAAIAKIMPNRTDNDIKNHWHSCLKKRLVRSGIDPMTHEPVVNAYRIDPITHEPIVKATSSATTSSPTLTPSSSTTSPSFSSTSSARLLNRLAAGISSRKHGLDRIKNVILSEPRQAFEEDKLMISSKEEEEEVNGCFMEIDDNLISTTSLEELLCESTTTTSTTTGFMAAFDDCSLVEPYDVYQYDFYHEADDQLDLFLEFHSLGQEDLS
ncbi:hypothetical protein Bca4012_100588 [Brassica carinata]